MDSFQSDEDGIPLSVLKQQQAAAKEDDIPLSHFYRESSPDSVSSYVDDSDGDPDFRVNHCEVKRCKEEVWAACGKCLILVCYDHCVEDITSCNDHGKLLKVSRQEKKESRKKKPRDRNATKETEIEEGRNERDCVAMMAEVEGGTIEGGPGVEKVTERGDSVSMMIEVEGGTGEGRSAEEIVTDRGDFVSMMIEVEERTGEDRSGMEKEGEGGSGKEQRGRKRTRNPEKWKRNVQKRLRDTGSAHVSTTGKQRPAKKLGPTCGESCILKCSSLFSEAARGDIFKSFWELGDKREQRHYITRHVERLPAQRKRVGSVRKMMTFRYYLYTQEKRVQVCRHFFLNTHNIGRDFIYGTMTTQINNGVLDNSKQGTHDCHKQVAESSIQGVRDHINSFAIVDSHYCRATTSKKYLDPSLSVSKMYRLYREACQDGTPVSEFKYRQVFDTEFNLGFHRPKKDQCDTCVAYRNKTNPSEEDKELYTKHQKNKEKAREIKNLAKSQSKLPLNASCAFDMQQILLCPHGLSSSFYYKRRLGVYNFTMYNFEDSEGYCYMWPETEARRGANEVSTCLFDYLQNQAAKGKKVIHMFSDNCGGQNRNRYTAFAIWFARRHFNLDKVCHTFLEKGHTETENDSIHATIERTTRRIELYTPQQWYTAVRAARVSKQPYIVKEMLGEMIIDFKTMSNGVKNMSTYDNGEKVMWSKTRQLVASKDDPNAINICTSYDGVAQRLDLNRRNRKSSELLTLSVPLVTVAGSLKPGINPAKKADLLALCDAGQIPQAYREFFDTLKDEDSTVEQEQD